jgi:hypothetical protein
MVFLRIFTTLYATVFLLGLLAGKIFFSSNTSISSIHQQYYNGLRHQLTKENQSFDIPTKTKVMTNKNINIKKKKKKKNFYNNYLNGTNNNEIGIVSTKDPSFFSAYQEEIDSLNDITRCERYGFGPPTTAKKKKKRRIFWGSLIASEPWETFEIVAAESYAIYDGIVLVESNRTQNFHLREVTRAGNKHDRATTTSIVEELFGAQQKVQVRLWSNEDNHLRDLDREHAQRQDILKGWKELGMKGDDIAIISDLDEVLTRDFLRAMQVCENIDQFDYEKHNCRPDLMGLRTTTQVYEGSPDCATDDRIWYHPSIFSGHCIEEIGDNEKHKKPPRGRHDGWDALFGERAAGWGHTWPTKWNESNPYTPLVNGGDFRDMGAFYSVNIHSIQQKKEEKENQNQSKNSNEVREYKYEQKAIKHYMEYTAYHFHNFFTRTDAIKFKYRTYGHPVEDAHEKKMEDIHEDLALMAYCARDEPDPTDAHFKRVMGGYEELDDFKPIYFRDSDYRRRRQDLIRQVVQLEDKTRKKGKEKTR